MQGLHAISAAHEHIKEDYRHILQSLWHAKKECYSSIHQRIKPFAIYFPQFHEVPENNINFYDQYTDMVNLERLIGMRQSGQKMNVGNILTPLNNWVDYYDLIKDDKKIDDQILTAKAYGIAGFALYHYWFCENKFFPSKNKVMSDVVDKFFMRDHHNFDFFFIWPPQDWNQSLNNKFMSSTKLWIKHFYDLLPYFKHKNYYKIDNKPVFFILESEQQMYYRDEQIAEKIKLWNELCQQEGFSGIYLAFTPNKKSVSSHENHDGYFIPTPSWKEAGMFGAIQRKVDRYVVDYTYYLKDWEQEIIKNTAPGKDHIFYIFPNFDNAARNLYPSHANKIRRYSYINATLENFDLYIKKVFQLFSSHKNDTQLLLINAWNEWGENMSIEPSNEFGFKHLECIADNLELFFYKKNQDNILNNAG